MINIILIVCIINLFQCGIFNQNGNTLIPKTGYDSLAILALKDTLNMNIDRFYNGRDSVFIKKEIRQNLNDTIKMIFHITGEAHSSTDSLWKNFYFKNDTFHIYITYDKYDQDSLSKSFQVLSKTLNSPIRSYANIDSLYIYYSNNKYVNVNQDYW